jgi:ribosomal protein S18 acetylase RimI-like enzyme
MTNETSVTVRAVRPEEWQRFRDVRLLALADSPDAFGSTLEQERDHAREEWIEWISGWSDTTTNRAFVAVEDDTWLGIAVGSRTAHERIVHVYSMWVDPSARRKGIGRLLLDELVDWARSIGASGLELGVTAANLGAVAFYERTGFVDTTERRRLREGSTQDVIVMRRELRASA